MGVVFISFYGPHVWSAPVATNSLFGPKVGRLGGTPALVAPGHLEPQAAAPYCCLDDRALVRRWVRGQQLLGPHQRILGTSRIDVFRRFGRIRQDCDAGILPTAFTHKRSPASVSISRLMTPPMPQASAPPWNMPHPA